MHFIHRIRFRCSRGDFLTLAQPFLILPFVIRLPYNGSRERRRLAVAGKRIRLLKKFSCIGMDRILISFSFLDIREKSLPYSALVPPWTKIMRVGSPVVEI